MLKIEGLHKRFGTQHVLRGIDLTVDTGSLCVVLGLSGSGKSVLMKHIIGLMQPDEGSIYVDDQDITKLRGEPLLRARRKFGMVFQQSALFDSMSVADNVAFPLKEHTHLDSRQIAQRVGEKLAGLGLESMQAKFPSELSGGMRKRVGLARALILGASFLLYDEPTTGLDPLTTQMVDDMMIEAQHKHKVTSVAISHDVGSALRIATTVAVIDRGLIIEHTTPDQLRHSEHKFVQRYLQAWYGKQP